ncbi:ADOP family duplicated permease [Dyella mobilis]|uniref:ABC transporter permease n=1 Tax=Dyella mobilis TaxID=1849582 RepID=A0ABS2KET8_9GAMM|nr:ADOP family duplicated permease [Dyella mobilis]MBM7129676.1 ABC transporter permease [Dyella mobilis]GLQ98058.1 hypothetical protein GCM10007863_24780 [Dyella mobilis]
MIRHELRGAWRRLKRRPGYALLSVAVLGVGLGMVLFVFSLVNSLVLKPLPYPGADRLVAVGESLTNIIGDVDSDQFRILQGGLRSLDLLGAYDDAGISLDSGNGAVHYTGCQLTASMLKLLGVEPLLGRGFAAADDAPGAPAVVLLSEGVWRHAFGADPHVLGRAVRINGEWATVVGVLPASFDFPSGAQAWLPLRLTPGAHRRIAAFGRLAPAAQLDQARAELAAWSGRLQDALPPTQQTQRLIVGPMLQGIVPNDACHWAWLMFGAGVLVLLLACTNVANLQLVQTLQRSHELALRSALGGSRARLVIGALVESALLSVAALAVALPIAHAGDQWLMTTWTASRPQSSLVMPVVDGWVVVFGMVAAALSTALAGGIPAWRASRPDLQDALRDGNKGSGSKFARAAKIMVVAEVALTVLLLVGAGTFVRALNALLEQQITGATRAHQVLTAEVALPPKAYGSDAQYIQFFDDVVERLRRNPEVISATASNTVPGASLGSHEHVALPGQAKPLDGWPEVQMGIVDRHFLDTYDVSLREGRFFDARDTADSAAVAVIDAKMAQSIWPHQDPLNRELVVYPGKPGARIVRVIGVIESLQLDDMLEKSLPGLLMPMDQAAGQAPLRSLGLAVRTRADAYAFVQPLTDAVHGVDLQAAVYDVHSQARDMASTRVGLVVLTDVFSALGLVALILAAAGLYGVLAFSVEQRTREIGIRRAIGAGHGAILCEAGKVLFWQLGLGLGIGLVLSSPWSKLLADPNLRTRAQDPAVFIPVIVLIVLVSALAALLPLLRALRVDPAVALRYE